jgi:hypothetical protein
LKSEFLHGTNWLLRLPNQVSYSGAKSLGINGLPVGLPVQNHIDRVAAKVLSKAGKLSRGRSLEAIQGLKRLSQSGVTFLG